MWGDGGGQRKGRRGRCGEMWGDGGSEQGGERWTKGGGEGDMGRSPTCRPSPNIFIRSSPAAAAAAAAVAHAASARSCASASFAASACDSFVWSSLLCGLPPGLPPGLPEPPPQPDLPPCGLVCFGGLPFEVTIGGGRAMAARVPPSAHLRTWITPGGASGADTCTQGHIHATEGGRRPWAHGDVGRCGEMRGDVGRCGEIWRDSAPACCRGRECQEPRSSVGASQRGPRVPTVGRRRRRPPYLHQPSHSHPD